MARFDTTKTKIKYNQEVSLMYSQISAIYAYMKQYTAFVTRYQGGLEPELNNAVNRLFTSDELTLMATLNTDMKAWITKLETTYADIIK